MELLQSIVQCIRLKKTKLSVADIINHFQNTKEAQEKFEMPESVVFHGQT